MRANLSLQQRLMVLVAAAILPLSALAVWFTLREGDSAARLALAQLQLTASAVAVAQDGHVEAAQQLLAAVAAMPQMRRPDPEACRQTLEGLRSAYPIYANIGITSLEGRVLCLARGSIGDGDASDRLYFKRALAAGAFAMGEMVEGRATGGLSLGFAVPVREAGEPAAIAFLALDLTRASQSLARMNPPSGARVLVVDRRGRVLMEHPPRPANLPQGRLLADAGVRSAAAQLKAQTGESVDAMGVRRLYATAATPQVQGDGLLAVVSLERSVATAAAQSHLLGVLAAVASTLLAGIAVSWWAGRRMVVKPAKQILGAVRRIEKGRLDARVPHQGREGDEFGRIAAAFNLMAESLQVSRAEQEAELAHSRSAYTVLDTVLNSLQEGLMAANRAGQFLMFNKAATSLFDLEASSGSPDDWPRRFGLYRPDGQTLYDTYDLPLARAIRGESGVCEMFVRNERAPQGRMLQCSFQPMKGESGIGGGLMVFTDVTESSRTEADLVLLRNAVARLNDVVLITQAAPIDEPGPRIVFVNEAFERLTGYTIAEALGRTPRMLQGPDTDRAVLDRIRAALVEGMPVREELVNYSRDGRPYWVEIDIVPMGEERGRYTHHIAVQRDVTARKHAEQVLLDNERELRGFTAMLQRTAEAAQAITQQQSVETMLTAVADQARAVVGAHMAVVSLTLGSDWAQVVTGLSLSEKWSASYAVDDLPGPDGTGIYSVVCETNRPLRLTQEQLLAHPRWRGFGAHADRHPPVRGLLAVPLVARDGASMGLLMLSDKAQGDFSERDEYVAVELAQLASIAIENARLFDHIRELNASLEARIAERTAELARQEGRYRALAEQLPEVAWNVDLEGRATYMNRAWFQLVGGTDDEWMGHGWSRRIHPEDMPAVRENWRRSQQTGQPYSGIRRVLARDGRWHTMSYRASPVLDEQGQMAFWVGIDSDITELKEIEQALRVSNQELEAFSYSVSHDLRAPLGAIGGFGQALAGKLEGQLDERGRHFLQRIQAGVEKMEQLIDAMLSLAKVVRAPVSYEPVDLSALARETLEGLQMAAPGRQVEVQVQPGLAAQGDARLLRLVLDNLVGNAWKFTSQQPAARIEVGQQAEGGAFFVRDNGVGFDMAYAAKLFAPFQRLHSEKEFPGTGVGLATVQRIVARHQGRVWAESQPGAGATFFFTLGE